MVGRAAGHDEYPVKAADEVLIKAQLIENDLAFLYSRGDGLAHGLGLLHDLLEHEVRIAALFGSADVPVDIAVLFLDGLAVFIKDLDAVGGDEGDLAVVHICHIARMLDERSNVRGDEIAAVTVAEEQRRVLACGDEAVGRILAHDAQRVSALDAVEHAVDRGHKVPAAVIEILEQLRDDLGIGLGAEVHALRDKELLYLNIVFDDAVMHDGDVPALTQVRVGVYIVRFAMRRPARMADAERAGEAAPVIRQRLEDAQTPLGFLYL